ncbi:hypothetical protein GDI3257 [Gluconacetobacter diazotrophicus PA1 5]|uniref:Uncharacterized protein n=1 Tax=Gluconacetobacter diazotrophicus (strain ATCC 49037 / DSM 5601 / CCUG 37298 / CIP 103539 / LMG 7603 / PAl5) TaxID=272568 RepID=A9H127_GLUDA|nr:hypothetical protein GDI3257 [Gluconacetobacter diazotrophicus PA1 5]
MESFPVLFLCRGRNAWTAPPFLILSGHSSAGIPVNLRQTGAAGQSL